jgi:hypothetical protein
MQTNNTPPTQNDAQQPTDEGLDDALCSHSFPRLNVDDLKALKQLGMRCLVMTHYGAAFASEFMLKLNDDETAWKQAVGHNPFAGALTPEKLDGYCDDWKRSLVDIDLFIANAKIVQPASENPKTSTPQEND